MEETNPQLPPVPVVSTPKSQSKGWVVGLVVVIIIALLVTGTVLLLNGGPSVTSRVRDVFIIFMALIFLVIGAALVILIMQLSILINLLQNEIKPILKTTNETVSNLKGTTTFLSNNLAEPVIKVNVFLAGFKRLLDLLRPGKHS